MKRSFSLLLAITASALFAEPVTIETISIVEAQDSADFFMDESNRTAQVFTQKSIASLGSQAKMNPYSVISFSPSVNFTPVDQAGSNEPSFHDPIRIRGKSQSGPGGVFMLNGLPVSSNPGGGKQMVDMENIGSINLYKGYLEVDKNLGFSSLIGKVDLNILPPASTGKSTISQSFGTESFERTFLRFDSGKMGDFSTFGSFSYLSNDKYKGEGDLERINGMFGLAYQPNDALKTEFYAIYNSDDHHNYNSLTYAEAQDLDTYFDKDYATAQPTASNDVNYYDWNKQSFDTIALLGNLEYRLGSNDVLSLKPYYKKDEGDYWYSSIKADPAKNRVVDWYMDHDLFGAVAAYEHTFSDMAKTKIGYWYHRQLPPGPPYNQSKYRVVDGELVFDGYAVLADNDYHTLQAPFVKLYGENGRFDYAAGIQYQSFGLGSLTSYTNGTSSSTSMDYDTAIAEGTIDPWASVKEHTFHTFLPSLYLGYQATDDTTVYIDYTRTYGFDVNLFPTYIKNRDKFVSKGVTLQTLWDELELETSDNIDLGFKTMVGAITLNPNLFVSFVKNKQANIYDPEYGVNYPANMGDALGYGAELSAYGPILDNLELIIGLSYNRYAFSENFQSSPTSTVQTDGNQLPDAPRVMAKAALAYQYDNWTFTPSVQYTSSRYGDVLNTQKIDAFTLVNLDIAYRPYEFLGTKNAKLHIGLTNLTDEKYIATINTPDNVLSASTTDATFQTGAPFGAYFGIELKF
jgi:iron complex outermembrane receptor protein